MTCRNCQFLGVTPNAAGKRVVRKGYAYPCTVPVEMPPLPDSITKAYGFHWPPSRSHVEPDDGANCPTFQEIAKTS